MNFTMDGGIAYEFKDEEGQVGGSPKSVMNKGLGATTLLCSAPCVSY